jgi:hypothetical protein
MNRNISFFIAITLISCGHEKNLQTAIEYDQNGHKIITVDTSAFGEFNGTLTYYYENGKLKSEQNWLNGFPNGDFIFYDESGKIIRHEKYNFSENRHDFLIDDSLNYFQLYDSVIVNFYAKNLIITPDTGYYIRENNFIKVKNVPYNLLLITSSNGLVDPYENYFVSKIKTTKRNLRLDFHVRYNEGGKQIHSITREVKGIE